MPNHDLLPTTTFLTSSPLKIGEGPRKKGVRRQFSKHNKRIALKF